MAEYVAGKGTTALGIIGTVLGALGTTGGVNLLNGGMMGGCNGCGDNAMVNRYEAGQAGRIAELETELKLRDANFYTLGEMGKLRDYVDARFTRVESEICEQKVYNATNTAALGCINNQVAQLMALTKLVIPNGSVCPGWGNVTVAPATTTTT
jgi:hypothetical protein